MTDSIYEDIRESLLALEMDGTIEKVKLVTRETNSTSAERAITAISEALEIVGKRFQDGEWFLAELVYSGEIARASMELLNPLISAEASRQSGIIVVGTVAGDLHDLGKNIFINYSKSAGFDVIDLGVDVSTDRFVRSVRDYKPVALGMSCLLTVTSDEVGKVIQELSKQGIRDDTRVIIGGAALTAEFARKVKADAFAPDAVTGTDIVRKWSAT